MSNATRITDATCRIELNGGLFAIIDSRDFREVSKYRWYAMQWNGRITGVIAGSIVGNVLLHRVVMQPEAGFDVDHRNGNPLDNRRCNLRLATRSQNCQNRQKRFGTVGSQYKGVFRSGRRWRAFIRVKGVRSHLGQFDSEMEAAIAYDDAARRFFGEFARPNFARDGECSCLAG